jgi:ubiquinone biosynthesis protein
MLRGPRNLWRALAAARTLARHDALFPLALLPLPPRALRLAGARPPGTSLARPANVWPARWPSSAPAFVKLGQTLSVRDDLIGAAVARDLSTLQDRLAPFPAAVARATIEADLGRPVAELFASFEYRPVARPPSPRSTSR